MPPTAEEFVRWWEDDVTQWVMKALERRVENQRQQWLQASWAGGAANQLILNELRSRATAWVEVFDTDYLGWCEINGDEPIYD